MALKMFPYQKQDSIFPLNNRIFQIRNLNAHVKWFDMSIVWPIHE
jgi:hypothetical protein